MSNTKATLIFCEGPHDAAFTKLTLEKILEFRRQSVSFSELPYPFSALFRKSVQDHVVGDLRLDMAKKFFLPDHILKKEETWVMIFNYGGSNRKSSITPFLERLFTLHQASQAFSQNTQEIELKYVFMADADSIGSNGALNKISAEFSKISETFWITKNWESIDSTNGYSQGPADKIYAYIWRHPNQDSGTLEDIIEDCIDLAPFLNAIDTHFTWNTNNNNNAQAIAERAKRTKAAISLMGQRAKPGSSMSVIVDQGGLIDGPRLESSPAVQSLISFLRPLTQ